MYNIFGETFGTFLVIVFIILMIIIKSGFSSNRKRVYALEKDINLIKRKLGLIPEEKVMQIKVSPTPTPEKECAQTSGTNSKTRSPIFTKVISPRSQQTSS